MLTHDSARSFSNSGFHSVFLSKQETCVFLLRSGKLRFLIPVVSWCYCSPDLILSFTITFWHTVLPLCLLLKTNAI